MKSFFICLWSGMFIILIIFFIGCFEGFFYPIKYEEIIKKNSEKNNISAPLIASIINVESGYRASCVSGKGAIGLMQIMPETAEWVCGKIGEEYDEKKLYEAEYNIQLGSYYLGYLYRYFGDENLTICAYNAGMGNVSKWMKDETFFRDGKLIKIPFEETRNYLKKVTRNMKHYKNKY